MTETQTKPSIGLPPLPPMLLPLPGEAAAETAAPNVKVVAATTAVSPPEPAAPLPPILLPPRAGSETRIDQGWQPMQIEPPRTRRGPLGWIAAGAALLIGTWAAVDTELFVEAEFHASALGGGLTLALVAASLGLIATGLGMEVRSLLRLRSVDTLRALIADEAASLADIRRAALAWVGDVASSLPDGHGARARLLAAGSRAELIALLRAEVAAPLRERVQAMAKRAAVEGAALVAVTPSPSLEGAAAGLRGLLLVRRVATLYGLRPGPMVLNALLKRVAWTAASVAGTDLFVQTLADQALSQVPGLKHIAHASGMSVAAFRLYRLALVTAEACSPLSLTEGEM